MNYLLIKNHMYSLYDTLDEAQGAMAGLKADKGVKLYNIKEIKLEVRQPVVPCIENE